MYFLLLYMCCIAGCFAAESSPLVVETQFGSVQGSYINGIAVFTAIPFAAPPVGQLRFQKPVDPKPWTTTLRCDKGYSKKCVQSSNPQLSAPDPPSALSEDCLYLNVFTPQAVSETKYPVLMWIHGGGFYEGATSIYPIEGITNNLAVHDVVVVSTNYRLNAFGFFTTNTSDFPANIGMHDQVKALQWVHDNIANFGGDPNRVTLWGESAGGAAVSLLTYSPLTAGLFQQAIMQSGNAQTPFALNGNLGWHNPGMDFAVALGCITPDAWQANDFTGMQECLVGKNAFEIMEVAGNKSIANRYTRSTFLPTIDGPGGFLPEAPAVLASRRASNITVMLGTVKDEAAGPAITCIVAGYCKLPFFTYQRTIGVSLIELPEVLYGPAIDDVRQLLSIVYGGAGMQTIAATDYLTWLNYSTQLTTDYAYTYPTRKEADYWMANNSTTYLYSFDYVSSTFSWASTYPAVQHAMELLFQFNYTDMFGFGPFQQNSNDSSITRLMGIFWTNFAKTGNPNLPTDTGVAEWLPSNSKAPYYTIDIDSPGMRPDYRHIGYEVYGKFIPALIAKYSNPRAAASIDSSGITVDFAQTTDAATDTTAVANDTAVAAGATTIVPQTTASA